MRFIEGTRNGQEIRKDLAGQCRRSSKRSGTRLGRISAKGDDSRGIDLQADDLQADAPKVNSPEFSDLSRCDLSGRAPRGNALRVNAVPKAIRA
jgi:hypothetical protein